MVQARSIPWIAGEMVRAGKVNLKDAIAWNGANVFYDYRMGGDILRPPVAYEILAQTYPALDADISLEKLVVEHAPRVAASLAGSL